MEFSKVNHSRHKVTEFDGSRLPIAEVKAILAEAILATSATIDDETVSDDNRSPFMNKA